MFIPGTDDDIEVRKNSDITGRGVGNPLFLVDNKGMQYIDCSGVKIQYEKLVMAAILNRTETLMPQAHCFLTDEIALQTETMADDIMNLDV